MIIYIICEQNVLQQNILQQNVRECTQFAKFAKITVKTFVLHDMQVHVCMCAGTILTRWQLCLGQPCCPWTGRTSSMCHPHPWWKAFLQWSSAPHLTPTCSNQTLDWFSWGSPLLLRQRGPQRPWGGTDCESCSGVSRLIAAEGFQRRVPLQGRTPSLQLWVEQTAANR